MELILSIAILAILTSSIIVVLAYVNKVTSVKGKKLDAVNYAEEGMEALLSIKEEDFASLDPGSELKYYHLEVVNDLWKLVEFPDENVPVENGLQRVISIQRVLFEGDPPTARILKLKVEVKWTQLEGTGNSVFIEKLISNWSKNINAVIQTDWCQTNFDSLSEIDIIGEQRARDISVSTSDIIVSTGLDLSAGSKTFARFVQNTDTLSAPIYSTGYISKAIFSLDQRAYVATDSNKEEVVVYDISDSTSQVNIVATGGTVTEYVGDGTNGVLGVKYRVHTFSTTGNSTFNVTAAPVNAQVEVFAWGGGGGGGTVGGWTYGAAGGAGGAARGSLEIGSDKTYSVVIGGGGGVNSYNAGALTCVAGGGACASWNNSDNRYGSGGGGYSGLFDTTISQANALIIAGGGGGGGSSRAGTGNAGGAGGGSDGENGFSPYDGKTAYRGVGGSQIAAGADASCNSVNTTGGQGALQGGRSKVNSYGGAGGGGYWGGSGGGYSESNTMGGGGGGSGYFNPIYVSSAVLTAGSGTTPGDSNNPLRGTAGNAGAVATAGTAGKVIIRYPLITETRTFEKIGFFNASGCDCKSPLDIFVKSAGGTTTGFVLMEDSLVTFDATTPIANITMPQLDQFNLPYIAKSFYIRGNYAFIGFEDNNENLLLKVLDVSDPSDIQEVTSGELTTLSADITEIRDVYANADTSRVYLLTNKIDGLEPEFLVLDSSNKAAMSLIDSYDTTGSSDFEPTIFSFVANDIAVIGGSVSDPITMPVIQIVEGLTSDDPVSCNSLVDSTYDTIYDIKSRIGSFNGNTVTYLYITTNDTKELKVLRGMYEGVGPNGDPTQRQITRF